MVEDQELWTVEKAIPAELVDMLPKLQKQNDDDDADGVEMHLFMFMGLLQRLKRQKRTGWLLYDFHDGESIGDHMYRMGVMGFLVSNTELDSSRCIKLALVHDIAESLVGDITPFDGIAKPEKHRRELATVQYLRELLTPINKSAAEEIFELWTEYETIGPQEARYVKDIDKFEFMVQCLEEEKRFGKAIDMGQCMAVRKQIQSPRVQKWADRLIKERNEYWGK